jgi:hemerythrin
MDAAHVRLSARLQNIRRMLEQAPLAKALVSAVTLLMALREEYAGEEVLMAQHRYPRMSLHRASHTLLESEFSQLARAIRDADYDSPEDMRARLVEKLLAAGHQLVAHVEQEDIPLAYFVLASAADPLTREI